MTHWLCGAALALLLSCQGPSHVADDPSRKDMVQPSIVGRVTFTGMCDASAAVLLDHRRIVVADDDEAVLRVYDASNGGPPLASTDLTTWLGASGTTKDGAIDIEAAATLGGQAFWLTSQSRPDDGAKDRRQSLFFVTEPTSDGSRHEPIGRPYTDLRKRLLQHPELRAMGKSLKKGGPEESIGLNLEGVTSRSDGSLLLGFRNPLIEDRALVIPLFNPADTLRGASPNFGPALKLELGGLAVRELTRWRDQILIIAGSVADGGAFRLYLWDGAISAPQPVAIDWGDLNPEVALAFEDRGQVLLLSDDGDVRIDGKKCGKASLDRKAFRGLWVRMP